jgi:hypothetical protein
MKALTLPLDGNFSNPEFARVAAIPAGLKSPHQGYLSGSFAAFASVTPTVVPEVSGEGATDTGTAERSV